MISKTLKKLTVFNSDTKTGETGLFYSPNKGKHWKLSEKVVPLPRMRYSNNASHTAECSRQESRGHSFSRGDQGSRHTGPRRWEGNTKSSAHGQSRALPARRRPRPAPLSEGQRTRPERPRPPGLPPPRRGCCGEDAARRQCPYPSGGGCLLSPQPAPLRRRLLATPASGRGRGHGLAPLPADVSRCGAAARGCRRVQPPPPPPPPASGSPPPPRAAPRFSRCLPPRRAFIAGGGDVRRTPLPGGPRGGTAALRAPRPGLAPAPAPRPGTGIGTRGRRNPLRLPGPYLESSEQQGLAGTAASARSWPRSCKSYRPEKVEGAPSPAASILGSGQEDAKPACSCCDTAKRKSCELLKSPEHVNMAGGIRTGILLGIQTSHMRLLFKK